MMKKMTTSIVITGLAEFDAPVLLDDWDSSPGEPPREVVEFSALYAAEAFVSNFGSPLHIDTLQ